jgi:hypothetical protein
MSAGVAVGMVDSTGADLTDPPRGVAAPDVSTTTSIVESASSLSASLSVSTLVDGFNSDALP